MKKIEKHAMADQAPSHLIAPHDQSADFVELFFDLVFVFAITKVTHRTSQHLDVVNVVQSGVLFWLIWWGWTQFTWALNSADTRHREIRIGTLAATAVAFVMAASTDAAIKERKRFEGGVPAHSRGCGAAMGDGPA